MIRTLRLSSLLILLSIIGISLFLYTDALSAYFFQDDWFTLRISQAKTAGDIMKFFIPRTDVIYFRPLGMQLPFFLLQSIFGLQSTPFHLLGFLTHAINIVLVFLLIRILLQNTFCALLAAFFYGTSTIHYIPFFWSATYAFFLGPTTFFLSFLLFLLFLQTQRNYYYIGAVFSFFVGLFVNEMVAVLPVVLLLYLILLTKKRNIFSVIPFFAASALLFTVRFLFFSPPSTGAYHMTLDKNTFVNLKTYILWTFNWPEEMKGQMIDFFSFQRAFVEEFFSYFFVFMLIFVVHSLFFFLSPFLFALVKRKKGIVQMVVFSLGWFLIGLSPVLFFPKHTFSYYLPIAFVGLLLGSLFMFHDFFFSLKRRFLWGGEVLLLLALFCWFLSAYTTISFNEKIHWAPRRAKLSRFLTTSAQVVEDSSPGVAFVSIPNTSEYRLALNEQDGLKVFFDREDIVTRYE